MPAPACNPYDILPITAAFWLVLTVCGIAYLKKNTEKDLLPVAIAFPIFVTAILGVMLSDGVSCIFQGLFGTTKTEVIKILGLGISGIIALYGFTVLNRRAVAQEKGVIQDRLKTAVDHLANERTSVRIASFYEFFYLARDVPDYAENILGILCAHLRHAGNDEKSKQELTESQTLVDILFSSKAKEIFGKLNYDLRRVKLREVDFQKMYKPEGKVDFSDADLSKAVFNYTDPSGFIFQNATLHKAEFRQTNLQKTNLLKANLSNADLSKANLSGAMLFWTNLSGAYFSDTNLSKAMSLETNLSDAKLFKVNLSGADLSRANLSGAYFSDTNLSDTNLSRADLSGAEIFDANLSNAEMLNVNLSGAKIFNANLSGVDLSAADLSDTDWFNTDLSEVNLSGADFRGADLSGTKNLQAAKLSKAKYGEGPNGENTQFPKGFNPEDYDIKLCPPDYDNGDDE